MTPFSQLVVALCLIGLTAGFAPYRVHVTTKKFCIDAIKDHLGNSAPCAVSTATETEGLTLPGMEDNSLTTREDVIVAKGGTVIVKAMPHRPFQFVMTTQTGAHQKVDLLFKNHAYPVEELLDVHEPSAAQGLAEDGWELVEVDASQSQMEWVKKSADGVDPNTGVDLSAMYVAGLAPDTWKLFTDLDERPTKLVASNSRYNDVVFQEMAYTNYMELDTEFTLDAAVAEMQLTYDIDALVNHVDADVNAPPVASGLSDYSLPEQVRQFYKGHSGLDWVHRGNLRETIPEVRGIDYFRIEKGSAADLYFNADDTRRMTTTDLFEMPTGCSNPNATIPTYCLSVAVDFDPSLNLDTYEVDLLYQDILDPNQNTSLTMTVVVVETPNENIIHVALLGTGCAVVWNAAHQDSDFEFHVKLCFRATSTTTTRNPPPALAGGRRTSQGRGPGASVSSSVQFFMSLPNVGPVIDQEVGKSVVARVKKDTQVDVSATFGVKATHAFASAKMGFSVHAGDVDGAISSWTFDSSTTFKADVTVQGHRGQWNQQYTIFSTGSHRL